MVLNDGTSLMMETTIKVKKGKKLFRFLSAKKNKSNYQNQEIDKTSEIFLVHLKLVDKKTVFW